MIITGTDMIERVTAELYGITTKGDALFKKYESQVKRAEAEKANAAGVEKVKTSV